MSHVYLLHYAVPINSRHPKRPRHYLGWTNDLSTRIQQHASGKGARFTQVAHERGIGFAVSRTWEGDRSLEFDLKCQRNAPKLCPICQGIE